MDEIYAVTKQDFLAARYALDANDLEQATICSNRLMANVLFGDNRLLALHGFFLRLAVLDLRKAGTDSPVGNELRPCMQRLVQRIETSFEPSADPNLLWEDYFEYLEATRKIFLKPHERKAYRDNRVFTRSAFRYLSSLCTEDTIVSAKSRILRGFIVEADRLIRCHGFENADAVMYVLFFALDQLAGYAQWACESQEDCLRATLVPFLKRIPASVEKALASQYDEASETLCDIVFEWRRHFLLYQEVGAAQREERMELPEDAKKRLGNSIAEALRGEFVPPARKKKGT